MSRKITLAVLQSALTDDPAKNIKRVSDLVREAASKGADVILPSASFAEKDGTYVNMEGRVQSFHAAWVSPEGARATWRTGCGSRGTPLSSGGSSLMAACQVPVLPVLLRRASSADDCTRPSASAACATDPLCASLPALG